jgi:hypothetical protein
MKLKNTHHNLLPLVGSLLLAMSSAHAATLFVDDYSTDTSANYDTKSSGTGGWTHNTTAGTLDFVGDSGWTTDYAMVKSSVYSHAANAIVRISGNITIDDTTNTESGQFGLVIANSGTSTSGGLGIYRRWNDDAWRFYNGSTRGILGDDQGNHTSFGSGLDGVGTYQFSATLDLVNSTTPGNALVNVEVITPNNTIHSGSFDIAYNAAWTEIGWRNRYDSTGGGLSTTFDDLMVTAVPEPSTTLLVGLSLLALFRRRR